MSLDFPGSYMFVGEYEMPEFGLGETFGYAETGGPDRAAALHGRARPQRPRGLDEWVAAEYAKVRRLYDQLGIGDQTAIEFFNGGHTINGVGTFDFLHQHLNWPKPK